MDHFERFESSNFNGLQQFGDDERLPPPHHHHQNRPNHHERPDRRNYKLVCDPALRHGPQKIYRFDGESQTEKEIVPTDPRSRFKRFWTRREPVYLPVPKFQYDEYFVGKPLAKEVTFVNLNDNINQSFLNDMCKSFGIIEEVKIYYHPMTKKHLGVAKVLYTSTKSARLCAERYHETTKMGNVMNVFVDVMGKERASIVEKLSQDIPKQFRPPSPENTKNRRPGPRPESRDRRIAARRERDNRTSGGGHPHHNDFGIPTPSGSSDHSGMSDMPFQDGGYMGGHHTDHGGFPDPDHYQDGFHGHHMPPQGHGGHFDDHHGPPPFGHDVGGGHGQEYMGMNHRHPDYDMHPDYYEDGGHHPPPHHANHGHNQQSFHRKDRDRDRHRRDYRKDRRRDSGENERMERDHRKGRDVKDRNNRDHRDNKRDHKHRERHKDRPREPLPEQEPPPPIPNEQDTFPPPSQPVRIPHHREDSPVKEEEPRKLSLESRIASLLRTNSQDSDSSGMPFNSPDGAPPPLPQESPPPLPAEDAPPLPEPPEEERPPLPPNMEESPPVVQWVGGGSQSLPDGMLPDGSFLVHEGTPNSFVDSQGATPIVSLDEGSRASGTPAYENGSAHGTPQFQEVMIDITPKKKLTRKESSDMELDDDKMSLASNECEADNNQDTSEKLQMNTGLAIDSFYGGVCLDDLSLDQVMSELSLDAHREVEEDTFSNVLDRVVRELKMFVGRDMDKRMIHNAGFKSFDNWWERSETEFKTSSQGKPGSNAIKGPTPGTSSQAALATHPQDLSSSLFGLFSKKEDTDYTPHHGSNPGGLLGIRGGPIAKLPSFKKKQDWRPPTPPGDGDDDDEEEDNRKGPRTPPDLSDEESEPEIELTEAQKAAANKKHRVQIYSSDDDSEDSESDKAESEDEKSSEEEEEQVASSSSSSSSEAEVESSDEEDSSSSSEEEIDVGTERDDSAVDASDVEKEKDEVKEKEKVKIKEESVDEEEDVSDEPAKGKPETENILGTIKEEDESMEEESIQVDDEDDKRPTEPVKVEIEKEADESVKKVQALSEKERGAFDVLMELKKTPVDGRPPVVSHDVEKDAALALLQMGSEAKQIDAEKAAREEKLQKERATIAFEHDYFARPGGTSSSTAVITVDTDETDSADEGERDRVPTLPQNIAIDHNYCRLFFPTEEEIQQGFVTPRGVVSNIEDIIDGVVQEAKIEDEIRKEQTKQKRKYVRKNKLADVTNLQGNRELASLFTTPKLKPKPDFKIRSMHEEMKVKYDFLIRGVDEEDIRFLKRSYEDLLQSEAGNEHIVNNKPLTYWLMGTHWMDHSQTLIPDPQPPKKRRKYVDDDLPVPHKSGCARTEGYYKISHQAKSYLRAQRQVGQDERKDVEASTDAAEKKKKMSRDARSETRRIQNVLSSMGEDLGDLLKFNQLQFRKKAMTFKRSSIHDWGLFAQEPIAAEEMVIEYVGSVLRHSVADLREKKYEASGIGSSYLFRIDHDNVIDATKVGNLARFINHCCNPNCYAKIITVDGHKKIVIYSKRDIEVNEEITYDYKFPIEDEKIPCLCGAANCRGTLN